MLLISRILAETVTACQREDGTLTYEEAVPHARALLFKDVSLAGDNEQVAAIDHLIAKQLWERLSGYGRRAVQAAMQDKINGQGAFGFFGVRERYSLDRNERKVKLTDQMYEMEVKRLIELREQGLRDDAAHLELIKGMYAALKPIWKRFPALTVREATERYVRNLNAA